LVLEPIASGEAVLTSAERDLGVALVDIGGGTTDIAIFIEGSVWHTVVLPIGGMHLTNDLAVGLRAPFAAAEEIKIKYGTVLDDARPEEIIELAAFGEEEMRVVSRRDVAEILQARAEEIFSMVLTEIKRSGYDGLLPAGIVLTGGTAQLTGIKSFAREIVGLPARVGAPQKMEGMIERVSAPAFATVVGLAQWGVNEADSQTLELTKIEARARRKSREGVFAPLVNMGGWLRNALLPERGE
jgi:cell division protein FtsA